MEASVARLGSDHGPGDAEYQAWAERLRELAGSVDDPHLAPHAHEAADLADQVVAILPQASKFDLSEDNPPRWLMELRDVYQEFFDEFVILEDACPA